MLRDKHAGRPQAGESGTAKTATDAVQDQQQQQTWRQQTAVLAAGDKGTRGAQRLKQETATHWSSALQHFLPTHLVELESAPILAKRFNCHSSAASAAAFRVLSPHPHKKE